MSKDVLLSILKVFFDKTKKIIIIKNLLQINNCLLTLAGVA